MTLISVFIWGVLIFFWIGFNGFTLSLDPIERVKAKLLFLVLTAILFLCSLVLIRDDPEMRSDRIPLSVPRRIKFGQSLIRIIIFVVPLAVTALFLELGAAGFYAAVRDCFGDDGVRLAWARSHHTETVSVGMGSRF
jgi:hypothetical protein